jgi:hypothetical protein
LQIVFFAYTPFYVARHIWSCFMKAWTCYVMFYNMQFKRTITSDTNANKSCTEYLKDYFHNSLESMKDGYVLYAQFCPHPLPLPKQSSVHLILQ